MILVRDTNGKREGPGSNVFSKENVKLNGNYIELEIKDGKCAEVILDKHTCICEVEVSRCFPKSSVFGFFLYYDDKNEYDIEYSKWNNFFNENCQFANQETGNITRFNLLKRKNKMAIEDCLDITDGNKKSVLLRVNDRWKVYEVKKKGMIHFNLWAIGKPKNCKVKIWVK
jgi:hypothetical protein